jgi:hypothetical protein
MDSRSRGPAGAYTFILQLAVGAILASAGSASRAQSTAEEINSQGIYRINAPAIYDRAIGGNVTIVIVDTGLLAAHPEFTGRVLPGYNAFDGSSNTNDGHGHGTHVAGILGASRGNPSTSAMFGVAYGANIMPIKVLSDLGAGSSSTIASGIQVAANRRNSRGVPNELKPFAMNLSLSVAGPSAEIENALRSAVNSINGGMLVAVAAGNDGGANPSSPARYAREAWAKGQILAVGAVDADNVIARFSNRAGDTRNFYIVAPGVDVYSTSISAGQPAYATQSGTSMATPYVTGAAALVKSGWPFLTAQQIGSILLTTATDLGAPGVDDIYGHGLLNLERSMQPLGQLTAPTVRGSAVLLSGTTATASAATGRALWAAGLAGFFTVAGFDDYGRDFRVDLAPNLRRAQPAGNVLAPMLMAVDLSEQRAHAWNGGTLRTTHRSDATRLAYGQPAQGDSGPGAAGYSTSAVDGGGREWVMGYSGSAGQAFGLAGELSRRGEAPLSAALANPYFALAPQHLYAGYGMPLTGGVRMKVGMLASSPQATTTYDEVQQAFGRRQSMALAEISGGGSALWNVGLGRLQETDSVLGATQAGALRFAGSTGTNVLNFGVALAPVAGVKIGAQYSAGYSDAAANQADSLVSGYTAGRSEAYAAFASLQEPFGRGDSFTVAISQPMRVVSGAMHMVAPAGADENGIPVMTSRLISLRPDGRELRADLLYLSSVNRSTKWFVGAGVRQQPDHDPLAPTEMLIGAGLRTVF